MANQVPKFDNNYKCWIGFNVNGKQSTVNRALDGSTYPSKKLVRSALGKINYGCLKCNCLYLGLVPLTGKWQSLIQNLKMLSNLKFKKWIIWVDQLFDSISCKKCQMEIEGQFKQLNKFYNSAIWIDFEKKEFNWKIVSSAQKLNNRNIL